VFGADLRFTPLVVRNVAGALPDGRERKSDLIKPSEPFALTLDHPDGSWLIIDTLEPTLTTVTTLSELAEEGELLKFTPSVVIMVFASDAAAVTVSVRAKARQQMMVKNSILRI